MSHPNSFGARARLAAGGKDYTIFRLDCLSRVAGTTAEKLPVSLKILLENLLRNEDGAFVRPANVETLAKWALAPYAQKRSRSARLGCCSRISRECPRSWTSPRCATRSPGWGEIPSGSIRFSPSIL
jgi:hypothetical protein